MQRDDTMMRSPGPESAPDGRRHQILPDLYELLVTHLPNSAVMMFDHDLRFVLADGPEIARHGNTKASLEGKLLHDAVDPAFAAMVEPNLRAALNGRRFTAELPFGDLSYAYTYVPVPGVDGAVKYALVLAQDVTELRRAEQRALQSEARMREIVANLPAVVFALGTDRRFRFTAGMALDKVGMKPDELVGRIADDVSPDPRGSGYIDRALSGERFAADGEFGGLTWETRYAPLVDPDGRVTEVIGVSVDVTDQRRAQQLDLQREKLEAIGRLAGGVAHDFNNMLTVIAGNAELALASAADSPMREQLEQIQHAAEHSARLTQQLLTFSRRQVVQPVQLNLNDCVSNALGLLGRLIGEDIILEWRPHSGLWAIEADPNQIEQVLTNLCINARDAIEDVGHITIATENATLDDGHGAGHPDAATGRFVHLSIVDDGRGMNADTLNHIFEPFFTTKENRGTGLGLATVFGIVKQSGGFMKVSSEVSKGTTFHMYFPVAATGPGAAADGAAAVTAPRTGHETILLVEDEPGVLQLERRVLERLGYAVLSAGTPEEAIRLVEDQPRSVDLLITDVVMPGMNGRDLARRLTALAPGLRVLFVSGYAESLGVQHATLDPGVWFLQKPFTITTLAHKVREALE